MKIGFIGLGHMGAPMALNLLKAGHEVRAFDLSEDALRLVKDGGAQVAASPREAAAGAEFVVTMLPAAAHVRGVLTQENGVLAGLAAGAMVIDSSTIDPASAQAFGELAARSARRAGCGRSGRAGREPLSNRFRGRTTCTLHRRP